MALGYVRYQCEYLSENGTQWNLYIYDSEAASGTVPVEMSIGSEGAIVSYDADERSNSVLASNLSWQMAIQDADDETFLEDILSSEETRFSVKLDRNETAFWYGTMLADTFNMEDSSYPYLISMTATDSLGRLKYIDYLDGSNAQYSGTDTLMNIITDILYLKTNIANFFTDINETFLLSLINWYNGYHDDKATNDPLAYTKVERLVFIERDNDTTRPVSCFEVLSNILDTFNARIFQSGGVFYIEQANDMANEAIYRRLFNYEGTYLGNAINTFRGANMANLVRLSGGTFTFMPTLKKVTTKYIFSQLVSSVFLPQQTTYPDWIKIGNVSSANYALRLAGYVKQYLYSTDPTFNLEFYSWFKMYVKIVPSVGNPYYLNNPQSGIGNKVWTQSAFERWVTLKDEYIHSGYWWTDLSPGWNFLSPTTTSSIIGDVYFKFEFWKFTDRFGTIIPTLPAYVTYTWQCTNMYGSLEGEASVMEGEDSHQSLNDNYASLSEDYELPDTLLGNNGETSYTGNLTCSADGSSYSSGIPWKVGEVPVSGGLNIHTIRCREYMLGQMAVIRRYQGTFKSIVKDYHLLPSSYVTIDSKNYVMLNMQLFTAKDETSGEWYQLDVDRDGKDGDVTDASGSGWTKAIGYNYNAVTGNTAAIDWLLNYTSIGYTTSTLASGVAATGVNASGIEQRLFEDDNLIIYNPTNDYSLRVTLSAGALTTATGLEFDSATPDEDIPSGAYLMLNNNDVVYWDDLRIVPSAFDFAGTGDPTLGDWQPGGSGTTFKVWQFAQNQGAFFSVQLPHAYKTGEDIYCHVHWTPRTRGNEESEHTVNWLLDYSWANINGTFGASTTIDLTDTCSGEDHKHEMSPDVAVTGTDKNISSMLVCKIYRGTSDNWAGTTAANLPALLEVDFHYPIDYLGSRKIGAK